MPGIGGRHELLEGICLTLLKNFVPIRGTNGTVASPRTGCTSRARLFGVPLHGLEETVNGCVPRYCELASQGTN